MNVAATNLQWDKRIDEGTSVPTGKCHGRLRGFSGEPTISSTRLVGQMCCVAGGGGAQRANDERLVRGSVVVCGSSPTLTASEQESSAQYGSSRLDQAADNEIAAEWGGDVDENYDSPRSSAISRTNKAAENWEYNFSYTSRGMMARSSFTSCRQRWNRQ